MTLTRESTVGTDAAARDVVYAYHERTKHRFERYARSLGYMDWDNQPDPFRSYQGASTLDLDHPPAMPTPSYDALFASGQRAPAPVNRASISRLFFESLAISAWKQAGRSRWSLRVNPSSGDLHPSEAYLISGPIEHLSEAPAVYHYSAYRQALEQRLILADEDWKALTGHLPPSSFLLALTSIYWRESWKYGERAYRYCHHDIGHAIACVTFAAAALGWKIKLLDSLSDDEVAILLGVCAQRGCDAEHPDCVLAVLPCTAFDAAGSPRIDLSSALLERLRTAEFAGVPNRLSAVHHEWPIIDAVAGACRFAGTRSFDDHEDPLPAAAGQIGGMSDGERAVSAREIIRKRRSAIAMDARTAIGSAAFYRMMARVCPRAGHPILEVLPWRPWVSLALFVHRVEGLAPGVYLLLRDSRHEASLRAALQPGFRWEKPPGCPSGLPIHLLAEGDVRDPARVICCHQQIAADGVFAVGMLAAFNAALEREGASSYPRLYWETGLIGQILYLEAEAAGIRATGIGCFFDDGMHDLLGIRDHAWQSLYHFTVGGALDDHRLQTLPAYWHLNRGA